MTTVKKIVAILFMILSALFVIALVVGLFGSWVIKGRVETASVELLLAGENLIATAQDGYDRVDELLENSHEVVTDVDTRVRELGTVAEENEPIVVQLAERIGVDLVSGIETAAESFNQIEANVIAVNEAVDAVRGIPMLGIDSRMPSVTKLEEVEAQLAQIREDVTTLAQETKDKRSELINGKVDSVTDKTGGLSSELTTARSNLSEADASLEEISQNMADLRGRIPALLTTLTIVINILILFSIVAYISLFLQAWQYFKCPDEGIKALMPHDCELIKAQEKLEEYSG